MKVEIDPANADLFGSSGNGVLDMCIVRDPASWRGEEKADAFNLGMDFNFGDWEALFVDVLKYPGWDDYVEGDNIHDLHERNRKKFQDSIPEYPMLTRIFDMYEDYQYAPEELPKLREECLSVKSKTSNPGAIKALRKLILAGEEASKRGFHLLFICD